MFLNKYFINEINANTIKEKDDLCKELNFCKQKANGIQYACIL